jgi:diketogulonate reductase-like aldo/keto reductase
MNNGTEMPLVGLGTWKSAPGEVENAVYEAIKAGYRHIDCAWIYKNQEEIGRSLLRAFDEGLVRREELWITSKLWNDFHGQNQVEPHLKETLSQLGLDYLDLYLIHWPASSTAGKELTPPYEETWKAMEDVYKKGLARSIGVSNMTIQKLKNMSRYATVWPAVNQVEMHPLFRQDELRAYCASTGMAVQAYSPLGSADSAVELGHSGGNLLKHEVVSRIARELGKTPGQVLIRWALQRRTAVVPKSVNPERIRQNIDVFDWELPAKQFGALSKLEPQVRLIRGDLFLQAEGPYRVVEELWDGEVRAGSSRRCADLTSITFMPALVTRYVRVSAHFHDGLHEQQL